MEKIILLLFSAVWINPLQAQITFQKTYGTATTQFGSSCCQTLDGGYVSAGGGAQWGEVYVVKTDAQGNLEWAQDILVSGAIYGEVANVLQASDGGYLINGYVDLGVSNSDVLIIKTDSTGNLLWAKTFGNFSDDYSYGADETSDGGYVIAGSSNGLTCLLLKVDVDGNYLWSKQYIGTSEGYDVKQTADGGFCIASDVGDASGKYDMLLIKTDSAGNFSWGKSFGAGDWESAGSIYQISDGGYMLAGSAGNLQTNSFDYFLVRTDAIGHMIWGKTFGGPGWDFVTWVESTNDGGFAAGGTWDYTGNIDSYLIKTDSSGSLLWSKRFGGAGAETSWGSGGETTDGGFVLTTGTWSFGELNIYLIKTDSDGNSGCYESNATTNVASPAIQELTQIFSTSSSGSIAAVIPVVTNGGSDSTLCFNDLTSLNNNAENGNILSVYPNPASTGLHIHFKSGSESQIELVNLLGKIFYSEKTTAESINIDTSELPEGIYFLCIGYGNKKLTKKISIIKY